MNKIILNGRGGSGKDSVADYLVVEHGYTKLAFADGIYTIAYDLFEMQLKDRELLQSIGQKMREIDPLIWVKDTFKRAEKYDKVVISDCRQHNEYAMAISREYVPIRVSSSLEERVKRLEERDGFPPDVSLLDNETENGADDGEFIEISNNSDLDSLFAQVEAIITNKGIYKKEHKKILMEYKMKQMY